MLGATSASAAVLEDFSAWAGVGTVVADPDDAGNSVLHVVAGETDVVTLPAVRGTLTMRIYDFGGTTSDLGGINGYGPRWGIGGSTNGGLDINTSAAISIIDKPFLNANQGYGMGTDDLAGGIADASGISRVGSWFSPFDFGFPRLVGGSQEFNPIPGDGLQFVGTGGDPTNPIVDGLGKWTTWEFAIGVNTTSAGNIVNVEPGETFIKNGVDNRDRFVYNNLTAHQAKATGGRHDIGDAQEVWFSGGKDDGNPLGFYGMLIDDIEFIAAPDTELLGDYNEDGTVDAADYTLYRDNVGQPGGTLPNVGGLTLPIGTVHYNIWVNHFGEASSTSNATSVPEPTSVLLLLGSLAGLASVRRS